VSAVCPTLARPWDAMHTLARIMVTATATAAATARCACPPPSDGRACLAARCAHRSCLAHIRAASAEAPFGKGRTLRESTVQLSVAASPYRELHLDPVGPRYITLQTTASAPAATPSPGPRRMRADDYGQLCTAWQHLPHLAAPLRTYNSLSRPSRVAFFS
jgi:hypothetical protein